MFPAVRLVLGALAALVGGACLAAAQPATKPAHRTDRLILTGRPAGPALQALHAETGTRLHRAYPRLGGIEVIALPPGADFEAVRARYVKELGADAVHLDHIRRIQTTPDDPRYASGQLWGLDNTGQSGGTEDADIDAPEAWSLRNDAATIIVGVIDTGIRTTHEDLAANLWANPGEIPGNGVDDDSNGYVDDVHGINAITGSGNPNDDNGHGTHCAGTIGAVGNNGTGVVGVAWRVRLMGLKFLGADGSGSDSDAIACIQYAVARGAHVLSNSWGGGGYNAALETAIEAARDQGIIFVAAAGNEAANNDLLPSFPASYAVDNVVAVAATDRRDRLASFSNFGARTVDLAAPGSEILSTHNTGDASYVSLSGTSMATPHVAGAVALLRAQFPAESHRQTINRLYATVDRLPALSGRVRTGGRLNLHRALATATPRPLNDDFASRDVLLGPTAFGSADSTNATAESLEPGHGGRVAARSVWWEWTAPSAGTVTITTDGSDHDTTLGVYRGTALASLITVASNDTAALPDGGTSPQAAVTFNAVQGTTYAIAVDGVTTGGGVALAVVLAAANDAFAQRTVLSGENLRLLASNLAATREPGEPLLAGNAGGRSLWWQWTAPRSGEFLLSTAGSSSFDTLLGVFTGTSLPGLARIADDDDSGPANLAELFFNASAGTTYQFVVDGFDAAGGDVELTLTNRFNDNRANARDLVPASGAQTATNLGATRELRDPDVAGFGAGATVWWRWTSPETIQATLDTHGSDFDTVLGVYTRTPGDTYLRVADNDDFGGALTSLVTFLAFAGEEYWVCVDGYDGTNSEGIIALTLNAQTLSAPTFTAHPESRTVNPGRNVTFSVAAVGDAPLTYGWTFNNQPITGNASALTPTLNLAAVGFEAAGQYRCVVSNAAGSVTSLPATLSVTDVPQPIGRLVNLSVRAAAGSGEDSLIAGFVSAGGTLRVLLRGVGPGLVPFGVNDALGNPALQLVSNATVLASNDNWQDSANAVAIATVAGQVGAFPLAAGSLDAALLVDLPPSVASALVTAPAGASGVALVEVYEGGKATGTLRNVSARTRSGAGDNVLIAGFVIADGPLTVLVRASGPALRGFGIQDNLADPRLRLFAGTTALAENDDWALSPDLARIQTAAGDVGAFPFATGSLDAALLVTLAPGAYSAVVESVDGASGVALVEVYAVE